MRKADAREQPAAARLLARFDRWERTARTVLFVLLFLLILFQFFPFSPAIRSFFLDMDRLEGELYPT